MDWSNAMEQYPLPHSHQTVSVGHGGDGGGLYMKVMTDEQIEVLRKQISVYATLCEQLVEMHKAITAPHDIAGIRLVNPYCDPSMAYAGNSISTRHRWTPTAVQLQVLERIFDEGSGTPSKEKIKDITAMLAQHGQISETNVYNWFQNRRARSKRKQGVATPNSGESEVETSKEKEMKLENTRLHDDRTQSAANVDSGNPETSPEMHCLDTQASASNFPSDDHLKSSARLGSLAWS